MRSVVALLILIACLPAAAQDSKYEEDFDFIADTVRERGAAVAVRGIDWKSVVKRHRPAFAECRSDRDHVVNCMRLLAELSDSHTGVWRSDVPWKELPSKWDGVYGGGLWFGFEDGRFMLRGVMKGHPLAAELPPGSALVGIGGEPAWFAMERERRRVVKHRGASSDHSLFASMGNRMLPFGEAREIEIEVVTPELDVKRVKVSRWGPGGRAFGMTDVQLPEGLAWKKGAISKMLSVPWCEKLGYVRITGSMDEATVAAFDSALDRVKGMNALLLDCRAMGGGSDASAWAMAGRLFSKATPNGRQRRLEPTGSWQFDGPVVMLQDELEVSSAETFTWAVSETGRVISVGRTTGGWGIIPNVFKCPSGLLDFRLGVNHRPTPITGTLTEGVGWPADIEVPLGPVFCARTDPTRELGLEVLHLLHAGIARKRILDAFDRLREGDKAGFDKAARAFAKKAKGFAAAAVAKRFSQDLAATVALERAMLDEGTLPDLVGAARRAEALKAACKKAKLTKAHARITKTVARRKKERAAQEALLAALDGDFTLSPAKRKKFLSKHGKTKLGAWVKERFAR